MSQSISSKSNSFQVHERNGSLGRTSGLLSFVPRMLLRSVRRAWTMQREERLLQELSDHHLRDLGIRREQIPYVLKHGLDR